MERTIFFVKLTHVVIDTAFLDEASEPTKPTEPPASSGLFTTKEGVLGVVGVPVSSLAVAK